MNDKARRSTIYLDPDVHQALRLKAAISDRSVSDLVNDAVRLALIEDAEDLQVFSELAEEESVPYETFLEQLKRDGKL